MLFFVIWNILKEARSGVKNKFLKIQFNTLRVPYILANMI